MFKEFQFFGSTRIISLEAKEIIEEKKKKKKKKKKRRSHKDTLYYYANNTLSFVTRITRKLCLDYL